MNIKTYIEEKYHSIKSWMQNPYKTPDTSTWKKHTCKNCGTEYTGNFCPQCGQNGKVERFNFHSVISNIMEVWGWGSRSMPRTLLHLFTRPGYMINDYLAGHRQPYFPPVKQLFILAAIFSIATFAIPEQDQYDKNITIKFNLEKSANIDVDTINVDGKKIIIDKKQGELSRKMISSSYIISNYLDQEKNRPFVLLIIHSSLALFCFILFKRNRQGIKLTLYEHFFCQMYIASQLLALGIIYSLITWDKDNLYSFPMDWTVAVIVIDFIQLFGGKFFVSIFKIFLALTLSALLCLIILFATIGIMGTMS